MELIGSEETDTPRTAAKKKKSALSRFAARKKKGSDGESDYGSKGSLGLVGDDESTRGSNIDFGVRPSPSPRFTSSSRYGEDQTDADFGGMKTGTVGYQPKVGISPRLDNPLQYQDVDMLKAGADVTDSGYTRNYDRSGITPLEYSSNTNNTGPIPNQRSVRTPSENTLERFQSLNVEAGSSFDASYKGEKRNRDQNSSTEEVDPETGHSRKLTAGDAIGESHSDDYRSRPSPRHPSPSPNNGGFDYGAAAVSASAAAAEEMEVENDSDDSGNVDFGDTNNEILGMLEKHEEAEKAGTPDPFAAYMTKNTNELNEEDPETQEIHDHYRHLLTSTPTNERRVDQVARQSDRAGPSPLASERPFNPQGRPYTPQRPSNLSMTATSSFGSDTFDTTFSKTSRMQRALSQTGSAGQALDSMSQRSYSTTCSLAPISTKTARERSFLVGSINSNSMLGNEELMRCFPDKKMKVYVATWNVAEKDPKDLPKSLNDFLLPETVDFMPDLCVIGSQESCPDRREWEIRLQETLGPSHVLFHSASHGSLTLAVFIRRDLIWFCSVPEDDHLSTRTAVRTKGSVGISFTVFGTSFLFINSHFKYDGKLAMRLEDYSKTIAGLKLPKPDVDWHGTKADDVTARFDAVFWNGDMNFRIERDRHIVDNVMDAIKAKRHPNYEDLLVGDELLKARNEGKAFAKFLEGRINFAPTYKFDIGTDDYDTSPTLRIPSYTDRILFRSRKKHGIVCHHYDTVDTIKTSDHRPVYGLYEVDVRPGRDNIPLAAGNFNRDVYLEANNRRAQHLETDPVPLPKSQKASGVCNIQ
ncbi:phosphatidylinositol polyphosphate 5-phosphatase type IV-like isoform X2 [Lineus longissimus]|uniref:phosphatidylinositol polyphosphate 5-phosphatase type IV-like isoform X2 n=1 Tax=Lineus longissimus TaxID=88925 RepID=UPI00315D4137